MVKQGRAGTTMTRKGTATPAIKPGTPEPAASPRASQRRESL
jgi:hypothetical protein